MIRFTILSALLTLTACSGTEDTEPVVEVPAPQAVHIVQSGDFLQKIAKDYGYEYVSWEDILLTNEAYLQGQYQATCGRKADSYRNDPARSGTYCNDLYNRPYGNTLQSGWTLTIPAATAPAEVREAITAIAAPGDKVALVIDDTGSMDDDTKTVARFYSAALQEHGNDIVGVWLYADGNVRRYRAGSVEYRRTGDLENTYGALLEAADESPDVIVLVTDEPGDDWNWSEADDLPKVIAHCIEDVGRSLCGPNLRRLATLTGGQYVDLD